MSKLAKEAIARPVGSHNHDPLFAKMEDELYEAINSLGFGPMGLGGSVSTLAVHIEWAHTHITQNPVAVNTQCWPARRARAKIYPRRKSGIRILKATGRKQDRREFKAEGKAR